MYICLYTYACICMHGCFIVENCDCLVYFLINILKVGTDVGLSVALVIIGHNRLLVVKVEYMVLPWSPLVKILDSRGP